MKRILISLALVIINLNVAFATAITELPKNYQAILTKHIKADGPGVAVIISRNGEVLFKGSRGLANIEHNIPLTTNSVFRLGSLTKQFTAAAIMMLQEQKKLNVSDNIDQYIPDFPTQGNTITIEHLLTHTSGLANYTEDRELFTKEIRLPTTIDEMLIRFAKHPMKLKTGEAMSYSNTGYVLLGKIIEVASGQSYREFIEQNIFQKLAMKSSQFGGSQIIPKRASGYDITHTGLMNASYIDMMWPHAAGALLSTVEDMNIWFTALRSGKLISKQSYSKMISPFKLNDGSMSNYGYGLGLGKTNIYQSIRHSGGIPGFSTYASYIPSEKLYIAVLSNSNHGNPSMISNLLVAESLEIPLPKFDPIKFDKSKFEPLMGSYQISASSQRTLTMENGKVYAQRDDGHKFEVIPISQNSFFYEGSLTYIVITNNDNGDQVMNFYHDLSSEAKIAIKQ